MVLYGFATRDERDTFEVLLGTTGVGPKLALAMLSAHSPNSLRRAVAEADLDALCLVPGVGKRTAQRLLVDLVSRLDLPDADLNLVDGVGVGDRIEARAALAELGYSIEEIRSALSDISPDASVEDQLRQALRRLAVRA